MSRPQYPNRKLAFEDKLDQALGLPLLSEEYGKNDMGYPDPTQAKQKEQKTAKKKSADGAHRFDPPVEHDQLQVEDEIKNEDTRIDFGTNEPQSRSRPTDIKPPTKLPKLD